MSELTGGMSIALMLIPFVFLYIANLMHKRKQDFWFFFFVMLSIAQLIAAGGQFLEFLECDNFECGNVLPYSLGVTIFGFLFFLLFLVINWGMQWWKERDKLV